MYDLLIEDATIVSGSGRLVADIAIEDGHIVYVGSRPNGNAKEKICAIGKFTMAGVIDTHVHFRDPGHPHKESWASGTRAAISGGVTTVLEMPNTKPPTVDLDAFRDKRARASEQSRCSFGIWAGAQADNIDAINRMVDDGAVGTKIFMGHSTGNLLVPPEAMGRIFSKTRGLIGVHAEDQDILLEHRKKHRDNPAPAHHEVRPDAAAAAAVERLIGLVKSHKRHVHICHMSTAAELNLLSHLHGELPITVEVCPHHLFLSADTAIGLGTKAKVNPPIRPELDRKALWTALKRNRIDTIGSDHAPHTLEEKDAPYWDAPAGVPGVETSLPIMLSGVTYGKLSLERMVEMMTERPARIFGLENKGSIEIGKDADLVLFREGALNRLEEKHLLTKVGWSPFLGRELGPKPDYVIAGGKIVAQHGEIVNDDIRGKEVTLSG